MNELGLMFLALALACVLFGVRGTSVAYKAESEGRKPTGIPGWEEFGPSDEARVEAVEAWKRANYAPGTYLAGTRQSRSCMHWAIVFTAIGALLIMGAQ